MIKVLEKHVADKIAAGEVIDRPISIVKELVENSLDAGATSITVEIRGGGKDYIRVTDDGCGIDGKEAEVAFLRHATSKISEVEDLDAIGTLGFRGEALASIAAVARVDMMTCTGEGETGRSLTVEGGRIIENKPVGCPVGTTIIVQDLFYNVPARLKFLASESAESRRITDMLSRIALAYPDVKFRLISGSRDVFNTSGRGVILDNILRIYGRDLEKDLIPVDFSRDGTIIRGFISKPSLSTATRSRQYFCVNGRVVSSKTVEKGLEKGYRERLFTGRHPLAFLFISVPVDTVDVNVHPTKKEIRFDDPFAVEDLIEEAVRSTLLSAESVATVDGTARRGEGATVADSTTGSDHAAEDSHESIGKIEGTESASEGPADATESPEEQVDVKHLLETLRQGLNDSKSEYSAPSGGDTSSQDPVDSTGRATLSHGPKDRGTGGCLDILDLNIVGIVLDTYIVATMADEMYLIDQHAAHERVMYEHLLARYEAEDKPSQTLLVPLQLSVSAETASVEDDWLPALKDMGYDMDLFGDRVYIVRSIPAFLSGEEGETFIRQFIMDLDEKPDVRDHADLERIIMRSCKSAVKGGDRLHSTEVRALLKQLAACDNPYSCPHGRPIFVKMSRYDLERMFKRA